MEDARIAYLAGFFDGEGSIGAYGTPPLIRIQVTGTHEGSVRAFGSAFRGTVSTQQRGGARRQWHWTLTGVRAADALRRLRPYLVVKAEEADVALSVEWLARGMTSERQKVAAALIAMKMGSGAQRGNRSKRSPVPIRHGTAGYNRGCRCDDCRAANAARARARYARLRV